MRKYTKKEEEKILKNIKKYSIAILIMNGGEEKNFLQINEIGKIENIEDLGKILAYLSDIQIGMLGMNLDVTSSKYLSDFRKGGGKKKEKNLLGLGSTTANFLN
ncbi:hypothetical protein DLH72_04010 [Candidatus Gracilibacteria bacterium]|nr:MAG: hypothetical protein DLH72_04010 [Candidatus Gracilibacteria bacterium]